MVVVESTLIRRKINQASFTEKRYETVYILYSSIDCTQEKQIEVENGKEKVVREKSGCRGGLRARGKFRIVAI